MTESKTFVRHADDVLFKINPQNGFPPIIIKKSLDYMRAWLIIDDARDSAQTLVNAIEARELAAALLRVADELDANRDAITGNGAR